MCDLRAIPVEIIDIINNFFSNLCGHNERCYTLWTVLSLTILQEEKDYPFNSGVSEGTRVSVAVSDGVRVCVSVGVFEGEGVTVSVGSGDGVGVLVSGST